MTATPTERPTRTAFLTAAALPVAAIIVCVAALLFSRAMTPLALGDPGAFTRWADPLVQVMRDLSAAVATGAFLLGGMLVPEGKRTHRRRTSAQVGFVAACTWAVTGLLGVILKYGVVAGLPLSAKGYFSGAWDATWQIDLLRALAINAIMAFVIACVALVNPGRNAQAWLFFACLAAYYPLGLIGHTGGAADHETAVDTLLLHIGSAAVWVGGLVVLGILWSQLGRTAATVVARYSTVATWCYVMLGFFGAINAWLHLGALDKLGTRYGVVLLAKVTCFVALGAIALVQRRSVVHALAERDDDAPARSLFVRLASAETLVMASAMGLAVALARSEPPVPETVVADDRALALTGYSMPPQMTASRVFTLWQTEWLFSTLAVIAVAVYLAWVWRLRRRGDKWPVLRTVSWVFGWLLFLYAIDGGVAVYGRVVFSAHMAQHMLIAMYVPIFLVRGGVVTLAMRALPARHDHTLGLREIILATVHSRYAGFVANPIIASILNFGMLIVFYYSGWFEASLRTHTGHLAMILHFLGAGYLFAWAMVGIDPGPPRWSPPLRLVVLLVTIAFHAFFGVAMMTGKTPLAGGFFDLVQVPWIHDVLEDQQRAGTVTWGAGEPSTLILTLFLAWEWIRKDESEARRQQRQAERDDDAELNAYNDYLASLRGGRKE